MRIGSNMRTAVVGAPSYFKKHREPKRPQDLLSHNCINLRLPPHGGFSAKPVGRIIDPSDGELVLSLLEEPSDGGTLTAPNTPH